MGRIWVRITGSVFVVFVVFVLAARVAEPSIRPVLYDARPPVVIPTTTVAPTTTIPIDEIAVLSASYQWGPNNDVVILQKVLGVDADGWYGPGTRSVHISENEKRGLSLEGVPPVPTTTTTTTTQPPASSTESVTTVPAVTTPPISVIPTFGGMGAELVAQLLGQPCIADGDLSDCPPEVGILISGLVG